MLAARGCVIGMVLALLAPPAAAESNEVNVAQQYGVSFLPLMIMQDQKLVEKHAKAAGLPDPKVNWAKPITPSRAGGLKGNRQRRL